MAFNNFGLSKAFQNMVRFWLKLMLFFMLEAASFSISGRGQKSVTFTPQVLKRQERLIRQQQI